MGYYFTKRMKLGCFYIHVRGLDYDHARVPYSLIEISCERRRRTQRDELQSGNGSGAHLKNSRSLTSPALTILCISITITIIIKYIIYLPLLRRSHQTAYEP